MYGKLLNNYTESGTLPVFRTQSQDRMVKTMQVRFGSPALSASSLYQGKGEMLTRKWTQHFAGGFFGIPEFLTQYNLEITVEVRRFPRLLSIFPTSQFSDPSPPSDHRRQQHRRALFRLYKRQPRLRQRRFNCRRRVRQAFLQRHGAEVQPVFGGELDD